MNTLILKKVCKVISTIAKQLIKKFKKFQSS